MGLWLLANTAHHEAAQVDFTEGPAGSVQPDPSVAQNVRGGPRSLALDLTGLTDPFVAYVNKTNLFTPPTHFVATDIAGLVGQNTDLVEFDSGDYPLTQQSILPFTPFNEPLFGVSGTDWCTPIEPATAGEAFGFYCEATDTQIGKVYFCAGQEFASRAGSLEFVRVPVWSPAVLFERNYWKLYGQAGFGVHNVSKAALDAYFALPKDDAVFFYDDTGGDDYGNFLPHKLWHCIILEETVTQQFDNLYQIDFAVGLLKAGDG